MATATFGITSLLVFYEKERGNCLILLVIQTVCFYYDYHRGSQ